MDDVVRQLPEPSPLTWKGENIEDMEAPQLRAAIRDMYDVLLKAIALNRQAQEQLTKRPSGRKLYVPH